MNKGPNKLLFFLCLILCMLMTGFMTLVYMKKKSIPTGKIVIIAEVDSDNIIDPLKLKKTVVVDLKNPKEVHKKKMEERKAKYGLKKEIDAILKPDESLKLDKKTIPMKKIIEQVKIRDKEVVEENLKGSSVNKKKKSFVVSRKSESKKTKKAVAKKAVKKKVVKKVRKKKEYGIHVVKKGENIWNIHFAFLKNYFAKKNIRLKDRSDEPLSNKKSSGVGKILKFSESKMVYIYNVRKQKLSDNIHIIQPDTKIMVYDMSEVFELLGKIDYSKINEIHFDGTTIWLPDK